jgi:hypothetical protein
MAFPDLEQNFAYSLASMARGLLDAHELEPMSRCARGVGLTPTRRQIKSGPLSR